MSDPSSDRISRDAVLIWLERALGKERGRAVWQDACERLAVPIGDSYNREQAVSVLEALSAKAGDVGIAARFTRTRVDTDAAGTPRYRSSSTDMLAAVVAPSSGGGGPASPRQRTSAPDAPVDLIAYLTPGFTKTEARTTITRIATSLGLDPHALTRAGAIRVLDVMAETPGLLGVVASFAKVKFFLNHPG